jgi:hypothetical protein
MIAKEWYSIRGETFTTKAAITARCRGIRDSTPDGTSVAADSDVAFLLDLFSTWHDEWDDKTVGGFVGFTTMTVRANGAPTRCFAIQTADRDLVDISFPHAVRRIETARTPTLIPQALRDFRNAARVAIASQTVAYRKAALTADTTCPITGAKLTVGNCAVDHYGLSFDELLFEFCQQRGVNPLKVQIGSFQGVQAQISDPVLVSDWQTYHQQHAQLRLIDKIENLRISKPRVEWDILML